MSLCCCNNRGRWSAAVDDPAQVWQNFRAEQVYRADSPAIHLGAQRGLIIGPGRVQEPPGPGSA